MSMNTYIKKNMVDEYRGQKEYLNILYNKTKGDVCFNMGTTF